MKRILMIMLLVFLLPSVVYAYLIGDVDGDGKVKSLDYIAVKKHIFKTSLLTGDEFKRADVNNDGNITALDYIAIRKIIIKENEVVIPTPTPTPTIKPTPTAVLSEADKICEKIVNSGKNVDYKDFLSLSKKSASSDTYKDDYYAIKAAHECANKNNKNVVVTKGTYHIYKRFGTGTQISVKTNTDLGGSTIYIHDEILRYTNEALNFGGVIYRIAPEESCKNVDIRDVREFSDIISEITKKTGYSNAYVKITDSSDSGYVFIRTGKNANDGDAKSDSFILQSGKITSEYNKFFWNESTYLKKSGAKVCKISSNQLYFKNGIFKTILGEHESLKNMTSGYADRGITTARSNTTLDNLIHVNVTIDSNKNEKVARYTTYEHASFFIFQEVANVTFKNSVVYGLKVDRKIKNDTGGKSTYDLGIVDVINMNLTNVIMYNNEIHKQLYGSNDKTFMNTFDNNANAQLTIPLWGVSGTNRSKYITFTDCELNRIDAHRGILVLNVNNSTLGRFGVNVTGAGDSFNNEMNLNNVTFVGTTNDNLVTLREDYGSTWNGTININNCTLDKTLGKATDASGKEYTEDTAYVVYWDSSTTHNYGYKIYLPKVIINGLTITDNQVTKFYVFNKSKSFFDSISTTRFKNKHDSNSSGIGTIKGVNLKSSNVKNYAPN